MKLKSLMIAISLISSPALANDILTLKAPCYNIKVSKDQDLKISMQPSIFVNNKTDHTINLRYHFRMCIDESGLCAVPFSSDRRIPSGSTFDDMRLQKLHVMFIEPGYYHYTVFADVDGDIGRHVENKCLIHVTKN